MSGPCGKRFGEEPGSESCRLSPLIAPGQIDGTAVMRRSVVVGALRRRRVNSARPRHIHHANGDLGARLSHEQVGARGQGSARQREPRQTRPSLYPYWGLSSAD